MKKTIFLLFVFCLSHVLTACVADFNKALSSLQNAGTTISENREEANASVMSAAELKNKIDTVSRTSTNPLRDFKEVDKKYKIRGTLTKIAVDNNRWDNASGLPGMEVDLTIDGILQCRLKKMNDDHLVVDKLDTGIPITVYGQLDRGQGLVLRSCKVIDYVPKS